MDSNSLVTNPLELEHEGLIEAGQCFLKEFEKAYPVAIAFWLKDRDESRWYLHVASEKITERNIKEGYRQVHETIARLPGAPFDGFRVRLRKMNDSIVRFALDFQRQYPGRIATIFNVPTFEGVEVEGMYLYPPAQAAAA